MSLQHLPDLLQQFPAAFDARLSGQTATLAVELTEAGKVLLSDNSARRECATLDLEQALQSAWEACAKYLDPSQLPLINTDESDVSQPAAGPSRPQAKIVALEDESTIEDDRLALALPLARLCRNMLGGEASTKRVVRSSEPHIRRVAFLCTTFGNLDDTRYQPLCRAIYQLLSNLVAPIEHDEHEVEQAERLWEVYTNEGKREDQVILRALVATDAQTLLSVMMLVLNFQRASPSNSATFTTPAGIPIAAKIMDLMVEWQKKDEGSLEAKCFAIGYELFSILIGREVHGELFALLGSEDEAISPSQITFLKLFDGYLQSSPSASGSNDDTSPEAEHPHLIHSFLVPTLGATASYAQRSLTTLLDAEKEASASSSSTVTVKEDPILPRVFEGCILLCQCLIALCMREVPAEHEWKVAGKVEVKAEGAGEEKEDGVGMLQVLRRSHWLGKGFIELCIELLGATEAFLPRTKPLRPTNPSPADATEVDTMRNSLRAFATLKRDLVQLLGLLVFQDRQSQDRVRECAGIELILMMCVTDENNPLIREYALLTVRNLMVNNPQNQAIIGEMDPIGIVGPDGELRELPARMGMKRGT